MENQRQDKRFNHYETLSRHEHHWIPGPSLETKWIPAGWKTVNRSLSSTNLKNQTRGIRNCSSHIFTRQKRSISNLKSQIQGVEPIGLFVLDIPHWVNIEAIISIFSKFGSIANLGIQKESSNFAFVDFESPAAVKSAISELTVHINYLIF